MFSACDGRKEIFRRSINKRNLLNNESPPPPLSLSQIPFNDSMDEPSVVTQPESSKFPGVGGAPSMPLMIEIFEEEVTIPKLLAGCQNVLDVSSSPRLLELADEALETLRRNNAISAASMKSRIEMSKIRGVGLEF
jgi:hypothetical protein